MDAEPLWRVVLVGGVAAAANAAGVYLMRANTDRTRRLAPDVMALAAGIIVGAALLHFGPELARHAPTALPYAAVSFFGLYVVQHHFAPHFHVTAAEEAHALHAGAGYAAAAGFAVHAVLDGLTIGTGMAFSESLGVAAALSVLAHEVPEGIITFSALVHAGQTGRRAARLSLLNAFITPVVAIVSFLAARDLSEEAFGIPMALAAGSLLYIGATDLLPEAAHAKGWRKTLLVGLGLSISYLLTLSNHGHV